MTTQTITVSTAAELLAALKSSTGGETILLEEGDYGSLSLTAKGLKGRTDLDFSGVTIASADPDHPASFSGLTVNGVSNLTIDNVVFDYTFTAGDVYYTKPFTVTSSSNITISNSVFDGDVASGVSDTADGYGYAYGLVVRSSTGVTIADNEFFNWLRGAVFDDISGLIVTGNEVHDIRSDGMDFSAVQNVLIEDNYFHDFRASYESGDHRDMIQFWTNGTTEPSTNITINNNVFDIGEGSYTQSIFMRNEEVDTGRAGTEMYYQNITITNNTIYNGHLHGITVGETDGLIISNNSLIAVRDSNNPQDSAATVWVPQITVKAASVNVEISGNAVAKITGYTDQTSWAVVENVLIQNSSAHAAGYYGDVFVTSSMDLVDGAHGYVALPGGILDLSGAGSSATQAVTELDAYALYMTSGEGGGTVTFDASLTQTLLGSAGEGATYVWTFGDGTTQTGVTVSHTYAEGNLYGATLTVTTADNRVLTAGNTVEVVGPQVVVYDAASQSFIAHYAGTETSLGVVGSLDGNEIQLGASGTVASVSRANLSSLRGSDDFSIDFSLQADTVGTQGEVFRMHQSFIASVNQAGNLAFQIFNDSGASKVLTTTGANLNDGTEHDISVQLSDGILRIYIDGTEMGSMSFTDTLPTSGSWDLVFGNPWGKTNFTGDVSAFEISVDADGYATGDAQGDAQDTGSASREATTTSDESGTVVTEGVTSDDGATDDGVSDDGATASSLASEDSGSADSSADGASDGSSDSVSDDSSADPGTALVAEDTGSDQLQILINDDVAYYADNEVQDSDFATSDIADSDGQGWDDAETVYYQDSGTDTDSQRLAEDYDNQSTHNADGTTVMA